MCDYCDCRSHHQLAALSDEHAVLLGLLGELRAGAPVVNRLAETLDGHAAREERGVFAELRRAGIDPGYLDRFERDHERIHALIDAGAMAALVAVLEAHILHEETDLFPAAHQLLSPEQWDAVDAITTHPTPGEPA